MDKSKYSFLIAFGRQLRAALDEDWDDMEDTLGALHDDLEELRKRLGAATQLEFELPGSGDDMLSASGLPAPLARRQQPPNGDSDTAPVVRAMGRDRGDMTTLKQSHVAARIGAADAEAGRARRRAATSSSRPKGGKRRGTKR